MKIFQTIWLTLYTALATIIIKIRSLHEQIGDDSLTWEKNLNFDIGIDFRVFKRLSGSIDIYHRKTHDLIMFRPLSATTGFKGKYENAGEMINKGIEFTLATENIKNKKILWNTDFNFGLNRNKITKLYNSDTIEIGTKIRIEGEALQTFYLPEWAGVNSADGSAMWYDENGDLTRNYADARKVIAGTADPLFTAGLNNTFTYKQFSLSFLFYLSYGNLIYNAVNEVLINDGSNLNYNQSAYSLERWQKPGDITDVPKVEWGNSSNSNKTSSRYLEDGSYLRLKNITLSYSLSPKVAQKLRLQSSRLYLQAQNLWTLTKYSGLDPEQNVKGLARYSYPNVATVALGLEITF
ncbi:MAG: hypothetical protein IPO21_07180 [Bacteroidales bacterium]|nr:hypothetical protein [Bacteroidales bacterium]